MALADIDATVTSEIAVENALIAADLTSNDPGNAAPVVEAMREDTLFVQANTEILAVERVSIGNGSQTAKVTQDPTFNCPDCLGEGMVFNATFPNGNICKNCNGAGKV